MNIFAVSVWRMKSAKNDPVFPLNWKLYLINDHSFIALLVPSLFLNSHFSLMKDKCYCYRIEMEML